MFVCLFVRLLPWLFFLFKDTLKVFDDFKSNKRKWSNVFWYVKVYIFWKFIQYTIHWDKTQKLKKFHSDKINDTKNALFFFRKIQLVTGLLSFRNSYTSWSTWFISLKLCVGFSIFESVLFLLNFTFLFNKKHGSFEL